MPIRISARVFDQLVSDALDELPAELAKAMNNVVILVAERNPDEPTLLGLYEGIALTDRGADYSGELPDAISIYREAIADICHTPEEVIEEVRITVLHEIAHHFGIDDQRLHELGWA
ncbi:MAG: metallopeptidase family protein [Antricoccus sp.]